MQQKIKLFLSTLVNTARDESRAGGVLEHQGEVDYMEGSGQRRTTSPFEPVKAKPYVSQPAQFMFPTSFPSRRLASLDLDIIMTSSQKRRVWISEF